MTLLISAFTADHAIMVSDMRLSWGDKIKTDDSVKCGWFSTASGRVMFAYTGLAAWDFPDGTNFRTMPWLTQVIYECIGSPEQPTKNVISAIVALVDRKFAALVQLGLPIEHSSLTVIFLAHDYILPLARPARMTAVMSNFQDVENGFNLLGPQSSFSLNYDDRPPSIATILGANRSVSEVDRNELNVIVGNGGPLDAIQGKAEHIISKSVQGATAVGPNIMVSILPANLEQTLHTVHRTTIGSESLQLVPMIDRRAGLAIAGIELNMTEAIRPLPHRNSPCSCGSGKKYRKCCGKPGR